MPSDYVELRARSAFSFLEGASNPEELADQAALLELPALALADRDGVYGAPRFHKAATSVGVRPISGAELQVGHDGPTGRVLLLVESAEGWRRLCRLVGRGYEEPEAAPQLPIARGDTQTRPKAIRGSRREKRACRIGWNDLEALAQDLTVLVRGDEQLSKPFLDRARGVFGDDSERLWVDVSRHLDRRAETASRRAVAMAETAGVPIVATGDVRMAEARNRGLLDALTCLRWKTTLDAAGQKLMSNGERYLQTPRQMARRFADRPEWIRATRRIAERCDFTLGNLGYRFPEYPLPPGETQASLLRALTEQGARLRYGSSSPTQRKKVQRQIEHELRVIEKLDLAGYFLIVHDIARFARDERILCQGRGSAANSAVCYALGITAVDPVGMDLLFERFLSEERGEWPDIDLDLPSGDQRERVIQYVFAKYGEHGAAMTANVITYRIKMAVREMGKVVGLSPDTLDRLSKQVSRLHGDDDPEILYQRLAEIGVDTEAPRIRHLVELAGEVQGLPRHLGQHSGGIVIAAGRLDEVVPIEPAAMEGRRVVQWDKDDCADLGIIKIDLLGLGMLSALEQTIPLIRDHEGVEVDLAHLPPDDPETYAMMRAADTIGVFQIESRAQMATLPRMKPRTFYDLVVEIAIIRPGPIVGQMVHPYLNRRAGREEVVYPHPSLEPILKRTLGVPIFQEQLLRVAMTAAGFSGGEAEELRRAMGFKRSMERMKSIEVRLREGMERNGFTPEAQEEVIRHITSFALYGFPESHSASFALIAYASSYLKCHHPAAFLVGLLNAWPMGFYNPATLVKDAQRHGVEVRPIDVVHSRWGCTLEPSAPGRSTQQHGPVVRIGLRFASGFREQTAWLLEEARDEAPFRNLADMVKRVHFGRDELDVLAELGALAALDGSPKQRRMALWQVAGIERDDRSLFAGQMPRGEQSGRDEDDFSLPELTPLETTLADYRLAGLTTGPQVMTHLRPWLESRGILPACALRDTPDGRIVRTAGHAIVRQRPGSAKGFLFLTLEDETGLSNAIMTPRMVERFRSTLHNASLIEIAGRLQKVDGVIHVRLQHLAPLSLADAQSADTGGRLPPSRSYR